MHFVNINTIQTVITDEATFTSILKWPQEALEDLWPKAFHGGTAESSKQN